MAASVLPDVSIPPSQPPPAFLGGAVTTPAGFQVIRRSGTLSVLRRTARSPTPSPRPSSPWKAPQPPSSRRIHDSIQVPHRPDRRQPSAAAPIPPAPSTSRISRTRLSSPSCAPASTRVARAYVLYRAERTEQRRLRSDVSHPLRPHPQGPPRLGRSRSTR